MPDNMVQQQNQRSYQHVLKKRKVKPGNIVEYT
jgi:hypothetical protein